MCLRTESKLFSYWLVAWTRTRFFLFHCYTGIKRCWVYMWTYLERTVSHEDIHYKQSTKWYCFRICMKFIISHSKTVLPSLCLLSERPSWVVCKQRTDNFTQTMWFDIIKWWSHFTRGGFTIRTASNTIKVIWYKIAFHLKLITDTCTQHER